MMKKHMRKFFLLGLFIFIAAALCRTKVQADNGVNYNTFTLSDGRLVPTQTAYITIGDIDELDGISLDTPMDMQIVDNTMYIASITESSGKIIIFDKLL